MLIRLAVMSYLPLDGCCVELIILTCLVVLDIIPACHCNASAHECNLAFAFMPGSCFTGPDCCTYRDMPVSGLPEDLHE